MSEPASSSRVVLVVDDDEAMAELERRSLSRAGMRARLVTGVKDALAALDAEPFSAILLDYQLPDGDPWRVVEAASARLPRIPVILVTAMGNERVAAEAIHRGVADYVKKADAFWEQLPRVVERVARLTEAEEQLRLEQARLAEAQKLAHLGSWEWDVRANLVTWSDELYRIFGRDKATFGASYEAYLECLHPEDRSRVDAVIRRSLEQRESFHHTHRIIASGVTRYLESRGRVTLGSGGDVVRMTGTAQDVTEREQQQLERERLNQQLRTLNRSLTRTLAEREVMLQEIHHRVKNNLQMISSLINLQIRKLEAGENRDALEECRTRVQAIALIHEKLYQSSDYARVPFADYAKSLVTSILQAASRASSNVRLEVVADDVVLAVDQAIPCGLVLNELITNALKHGFRDGRAGTIRVEFGRAGAGLARLSVKNDGIALPPGFQLKGSPSLGLHLVSMLASQLSAELEVSRAPGTAFQLTFALPETDADPTSV